VSNAVKYTRQGLVELKCLHAQASVRIEVLDTGIGMPADQLGRIYDEFYQIRGKADGARDGYGLGLSIVRQVVRLLDLKLDVSSELGKGSTFSLQVPASAQYRRREAAGRRAPGAEPSVGGRPLHVLLVEDDEAVRSATQLLLRVAGYRVTVAGSVAEAAEQARQQEPFDLLIADYHLGTDATGLDAIAAARALQGRAVKAVLVTGDTSSLVQGLDYDANTRLTTKPVHAGEFLALLAELHPCN
jgi:CheY-like chemotaxis protein